MADEVEGLVAQLADSSWEVRQRAADRLGELGAAASPALPNLRDKLLNDTDEDVRASAVRAAVAVAPEPVSLLPDLRKGLGDPNWKVKVAAAQALATLGPEARSALDVLLENVFGDVDVKVAVAQAVDALYPEEGAFLALAKEQVATQAFSGPAAVHLVAQLDRPAERDEVEAFLWNLVRTHPEARFYGTAFNTLVDMDGDDATVVRQMLDDQQLPPMRRGELYVYGSGSTSLDAELPQLIGELLPLVLATFESELVEARQQAALWVSVHRDLIPAELLPSVVDATSANVTNRGEGLELLRSLVGDDAALQVLYNTEPSRQAYLLFRESTDLTASVDPERLADLALAGAQDAANWVTRQAAADWVKGNVATIPAARLEEISAALRVLTTDYDPDVRRSAEVALIEVDQRGRVTRSSTLFDALRTEGDEAKVEVIGKILQLRDRDTTRRLVREWIRWHAGRKEPLLVEIVREALRTQPEAVRPLVDQYDQVDQDAELDAEIIELLEVQSGIPKGLAVRIRDEQTDKQEASVVADWLARCERVDPEFARLGGQAREEQWKPSRHAAVAMDRILRDTRGEVRTTIRERVAQQLADMSDIRYFTSEGQSEDEDQSDYRDMLRELELHALPMLTRALAVDDTDHDNTTIREAATRALGNIGGREAVEALTRAVIGEERTRQRRQELLAEYYLEPSKARSDEAATILRSAVKSAERTLHILQVLNIALFCVGLGALVAGITIGLMADDRATRVAAAFAGLGGLAGIVVELVRNPLEQIQKAMTRLVQLETAFTSFIWELNLNGTYIQSQYVARGVLSDEEIATTVARIEGAMTLAMDLVATHTQERDMTARPTLYAATPVAARTGTTIAITGDGLRGLGDVRRKAKSLVALDHVPVALELSTWSDREVRFMLSDQHVELNGAPRQVWVSLIVDGRETNAVPFTVLPAVVEAPVS